MKRCKKRVEAMKWMNEMSKWMSTNKREREKLHEGITIEEAFCW
jgi:hypothetical protein